MDRKMTSSFFKQLSMDRKNEHQFFFFFNKIDIEMKTVLNVRNCIENHNFFNENGSKKCFRFFLFLGGGLPAPAGGPYFRWSVDKQHR